MAVKLKKKEAKTEAKPEKKGLGVPDLAEALGLTPFTVREKLRRHGVEKKDKSYSFTKAELESLVKKFKAEPKEARKEENRKPRKKAA